MQLEQAADTKSDIFLEKLNKVIEGDSHNDELTSSIEQE
jgi:hypothetical protein